jgi:hypothetical protein
VEGLSKKLLKRTASIQNVGPEEDIFINLPIIAIYLQLSLQSGFDEEQSIAIHSEAFRHQL